MSPRIYKSFIYLNIFVFGLSVLLSPLWILLNLTDVRYVRSVGGVNEALIESIIYSLVLAVMLITSILLLKYNKYARYLYNIVNAILLFMFLSLMLIVPITDYLIWKTISFSSLLASSLFLFIVALLPATALLIVNLGFKEHKKRLLEMTSS
ncbi:hypothetical protein CL630_00925 [bacterium]|nr:hypothetical protein [bacterium]|tara:strand:- start:15043 stop:15498 length:456 start_codon:yes stop_codon:yes gene_type:complete